MSRTLAAAGLAAVLALPAFAEDKQPAPLAPGRPAGVREARFHMNYPAVFIGAALAVVVGGLYLSQHGQATTSTAP